MNPKEFDRVKTRAQITFNLLYRNLSSSNSFFRSWPEAASISAFIASYLTVISKHSVDNITVYLKGDKENYKVKLFIISFLIKVTSPCIF